MTPMFNTTDTQDQMVEALARWLADAWPFEQRAARMATPGGIQPLWQGLARLGLLGAALPESAGGSGGGLAEHLLLLHTLGPALASEPYLGTAVVGAGLLQRCGGAQATQRLAGGADGALRIALAALEPHSRHHIDAVDSRIEAQAGGGWRLQGRKALVLGGPWATHLIATARDGQGSLHLLWLPADAAGVQRRDLRTVDGQWASEIAFEGVALPADAVLASGDAAQQALALAIDEATLATGAEALGVMDKLVADTVDYARQRQQFGVAIASFQALQHRLADMHLARVQAAALVGATLAAMDGSAAERQRAVSSAQVAVARACRTVGQGAVQIHGGMGMTDELWVGHGFKRLTMLERQFGTIHTHLRRVAQASAWV